MLLGPSASLNFREERCQDTAAVLHTAIVMQQALGGDAPLVVRELVRAASWRGHLGGGRGTALEAATGAVVAAAAASRRAALPMQQQSGSAVPALPLPMLAQVLPIASGSLQQSAAAAAAAAPLTRSGSTNNSALLVDQLLQQCIGAQQPAAVQIQQQQEQEAASTLDSVVHILSTLIAGAAAAPITAASSPNLAAPDAEVDLASILLCLQAHANSHAAATAPIPLLPATMQAAKTSAAAQAEASGCGPDSPCADNCASTGTVLGGGEQSSFLASCQPSAEAVASPLCAERAAVAAAGSGGAEPGAPIDRRAMFAAAMDEVGNLLLADPDLLTQYLCERHASPALQRGSSAHATAAAAALATAAVAAIPATTPAAAALAAATPQEQQQQQQEQQEARGLHLGKRSSADLSVVDDDDNPAASTRRQRVTPASDSPSPSLAPPSVAASLLPSSLLASNLLAGFRLQAVGNGALALAGGLRQSA